MPRLTLTAALILWFALAQAPSRPATLVPTPTITGPIPATATPGDPSHNYPYLSMRDEVAAAGYREDEFFVEGRAQAHMTDGAGMAPPTPEPNGPYPYKTRVIVRRPLSASRFNGTVILEWIRAADVDQENDWWWSHEHFMRAGYVYVGVSAQPRSIEVSPLALKRWNPLRYGSLDVSAGGKFLQPQSPYRLSFDIYSQVAQAVRQPQSLALLGGLKVRSIIATGHSGSAAQLRLYYNAFQSSAHVVDGFVFHGIGGGSIRTDVKTPGWRLQSEFDVLGGGERRPPDTQYLRTWEVAGAAHAGWDLIHVLNPLFARDFPPSQDGTCDKPPFSRVPSYLVQNAVYDWMKIWIEKGTAPPHAPPITLTTTDTANGPAVSVARDEHGNALGGIRLAEVDVPTATNTGINSGGQFCGIFGSHVPFDAAKLARLYPTHAAYVTAVERVTQTNLKAGYITKEGAAETIRAAAQSKIGAAAR